jgi:hypothetical protein
MRIGVAPYRKWSARAFSAMRAVAFTVPLRDHHATLINHLLPGAAPMTDVAMGIRASRGTATTWTTTPTTWPGCSIIST